MTKNLTTDKHGSHDLGIAEIAKKGNFTTETRRHGEERESVFNLGNSGDFGNVSDFLVPVIRIHPW